MRALLDGELEPGESRKVLTHLESCAPCRAEHARLQQVVTMLQQQEPEEVPAHFGADLHVRLARHRQERAKALRRRRWIPRLPALPSVRRLKWAGATLTVGLALAFTLLSGRLSAADVANRARLSWMQIRNYGCIFVSDGVYRGKQRHFYQKQFFRRPDEFYVETGQDYALSTYIYKDRIIHYLPHGDWKGRGPLAIVRPRRQGRDGLPFPYGVTWQSEGNISLDLLIRQLNDNDDARLAGTEKVGERDCYRVSFTAVPPGGSEREQFELWVDTESFLPRRMSWYRDPENHIVTEAQSLQVNYDVLPAGTFDFNPPPGTVIVHGDVDPHVLALPYDGARTVSWRAEPVSTARSEAWKRASAVPFPVLAPEWLPAGTELVRVRRKAGLWMDLHWLRENGSGPATIVKLVEQDAGEEDSADVRSGETVNLGTRRRPVVARLVVDNTPYAHVYLTWRRGGTRCELFASGLTADEVQRIARSMSRVTAPVVRPAVTIARGPGPGQIREATEPSAIPTETASTAPTEPAESVREPAPSPSTSVETPQQPPMMPEMPDPEPTAAAPERH
jgi:outer membrane lipoprotein-sorting protein